MLWTIDDRDGRAPIALARDQPVSQAVVHRTLSFPLLLQPFRHYLHGDLSRCAAEFTRVDHPAIFMMVQGILVKLATPKHFHQRARLLAARFGSFAPLQDARLALQRIPFPDSIGKYERPAIANHLDPRIWQDKPLRQINVAIDFIRRNG